jgi:hypothetical protein
VIHSTTLAQAFRQNADHFSRLQRRVDMAHRNYRNALQDLLRLQAEEVLEPEPLTPLNQTAKPQNGFVPRSMSESPVDIPPSPVKPASPASPHADF